MIIRHKYFIILFFYLTRLGYGIEIAHAPIRFSSGEILRGLGYFAGLALSPDNQNLALCGKGGVYLVRRETGIIEKWFLPNYNKGFQSENNVSRVEFSPDGSKLLVSYDYSMGPSGIYRTKGVILDVSTSKELFSISGPKYPFGIIAFRPFSLDGKQLVYAGENGTTLVDLETGKQTVQPLIPWNSYSFFNHNNEIVTAQASYLEVWNAQTGQKVRAIVLESVVYTGLDLLGEGAVPGTLVGFVYFQPGGHYPPDSEIYPFLWDSQTGKIIKKWDQRLCSPYIFCLDISSDGRFLAFVPEYITGEPIDVTADPSVRVPTGNILGGQNQCYFSPDSKYLLILVYDGMYANTVITMYDMATGKVVDQLTIPAEPESSSVKEFKLH